jgi:hypothetical protein
MTEDIRIDIHELNAYAEQIDAVQADIVPRLRAAVAQVPLTSPEAFRRPGRGGDFAEGVLLDATSQRIAEVFAGFADGLHAGLDALVTVARATAAHYLETDAASAAAIAAGGGPSPQD